MSDPVWAYLERLPGKSAALFDWDQALSGWDRYPLFRDHFLQLTKSHATAVDCPSECGLGCPRSVVTHAKTNIRAVCNEKEGPAIAEKLLAELGFSGEVSERVQYLIAHHHTYNNIDGIDYQILVEADFLVNMCEDELSEEALQNTYQNIFRTETGKKICREMYDIA